MKKVVLLLLLPIVSILSVSCEGEQGPPGFDGVNILGSVFEANVDFNADSNPENNFTAVVDFPNSIEIFDTDVVVAYKLTGQEDGLDVWEPLPQTLFFDYGILHYTFDYTQGGVKFLLDGTVILEDLSPEFTQNIIFRIAVLPADEAQNLNLNNIESVTNSLRHNEVIKLN